MKKPTQTPGSIYPKDGRIYFRLKVNGKWRGVPTEFRVGQERQAKRALEEVRALQSAGAAITGTVGKPVTCRDWFGPWLEKRKLKVATWKDDERAMRLYWLPAIGDMRLDAVRPLHLLEVVESMQGEGLAPRSVHTLYSSLRSFFRDACLRDLLGSTPCLLTKHNLGEKKDKDRNWRMTAKFSRDELEMLISDDRIPLDRRLMYALKGVAGLRHSEAARLEWRFCGMSAEPLNMIWVHGKNEIDRPVPIHPTLAAMLAEWRLRGWREMMGRPLGETDLVLPLGPRKSNGGSKARPNDAMRTKKDSQRAFLADLETLGLRRRRGHDLRRTMISLAQTDGAIPAILKRATHKPPKEVFEQYTTFEFDIVCREVLKLNVRLRNAERKVIALPRAANDVVGLAAPHQNLATHLATPSAQICATITETTLGPPGFEPGGNRYFRQHSASPEPSFSQKTPGYKEHCPEDVAVQRSLSTTPRSKVASEGVDALRARLETALTSGVGERETRDLLAQALVILESVEGRTKKPPK